MYIENQDLFERWLEFRLLLISNTDPYALARYILVLINKDKPIEELKILCTDQLDVFLRDETRKFVEDLFECLESKSYLEFDAEEEALKYLNSSLYPMEFPF